MASRGACAVSAYLLDIMLLSDKLVQVFSRNLQLYEPYRGGTYAEGPGDVARTALSCTGTVNVLRTCQCVCLRSSTNQPTVAATSE